MIMTCTDSFEPGIAVDIAKVARVMLYLFFVRMNSVHSSSVAFLGRLKDEDFRMVSFTILARSSSELLLVVCNVPLDGGRLRSGTKTVQI